MLLWRWGRYQTCDTDGMTEQQIAHLLTLEGRRVTVALADGSRIDDCELVSAGRHSDNVWLFAGGVDTFVSVHDIIEFWERPFRSNFRLR